MNEDIKLTLAAIALYASLPLIFICLVVSAVIALIQDLFYFIKAPFIFLLRLWVSYSDAWRARHKIAHEMKIPVGK